ncbi:hypothetical protein EVAR_60571_1 [Eumeta japonica]|uniref:Uncharacterized protein n=1 Tax=Eumeta variegata TaxID=151549 RepID=A0A4C1YDG1_EUMVA|nr:hypothetical protein EVAR_60571_1 [Eumeta japonica]
MENRTGIGMKKNINRHGEQDRDRAHPALALPHKTIPPCVVIDRERHSIFAPSLACAHAAYLINSAVRADDCVINLNVRWSVRASDLSPLRP